MIQIVGAMLMAWTVHQFVKEVTRNLPRRQLARVELKKSLKIYKGYKK